MRIDSERNSRVRVPQLLRDARGNPLRNEQGSARVAKCVKAGPGDAELLQKWLKLALGSNCPLALGKLDVRLRILNRAVELAERTANLLSLRLPSAKIKTYYCN